MWYFHVLSDKAAFTTQSRISLRSYANNFIIAARFHNIDDIVGGFFFAYIVSELRLCVANAASSESTWWRFTTDYRTGFPDQMRTTITCDLSCSPTLDGIILNKMPWIFLSKFTMSFRGAAFLFILMSKFKWIHKYIPKPYLFGHLCCCLSQGVCCGLGRRFSAPGALPYYSASSGQRCSATHLNLQSLRNWLKMPQRNRSSAYSTVTC